MGKAAKGKQRRDEYYHLAKEQGYRSRAAFKLQQLDDRFRFLPAARAVLDLCAAPGGWVQVAVARAPAGAFVVGVDLVPIRPVRGAHSLTEDITTTRCRSAVRRLMDSRGVAVFDVVLHDGSPNVGGAWAQEATAQSALVIDAVRLATAFLAPKGAFITKVFRSQDYSAIMFCLKQLFDKVEVTKPRASRGTSAEIYIICLKYKAPAKIQPELLDIKHLFSVDPEKSTPTDVLDTNKNAKKRTRGGYAAGVTVLEKVGLASDFIWSEAQKPREFLGSFTKISFDDPVLDKNSFKHILKWRTRVRNALPSSLQVTPKADGTATDTKVKGDVQLLQEMEEMGSDEEHQLDGMLDEAYERYVTKKGEEVKQEHKRCLIDPDADAVRFCCYVLYVHTDELSIVCMHCPEQAKTARKIVLKLQCQSCKHCSQRSIKRSVPFLLN
ncbi:hypothetical protein ZWY2020_044532 [Hordeum vulgare]|nr:hypothetical protein ZWY2020_044532 [Hordeum vulgare]